MTTDTATTPGPSRYVRRLLARVRALDAARPWVWDATLTAALTTSALVDAAGGGWRTVARDPALPTWLVLALSLALTLPLHWRRRRPTAVLAALTAAALISTTTGAFLQAGYFQAVPVFHIALRRPPRALLGATALVAAPLVAGALRFPAGTPAADPLLWTYALAALLGITVRSRQEERAQEVRLAAAAERARIAREMHDIIGHNLSVITGLADGGRYAAAKNPERAAQALDAIGTTSRQALTELRRVLGVLTADRTPQPGLAELPSLIEGVRKAGLPVRSSLDAIDGHTLSTGAELTVYRVVQEALTNTMKHAGPGATATVTLESGPQGVRLTVTDTGKATGPLGSGQGLTGMRERAALYDGTLDCGPLPPGPGSGSGWRVRLRLPREDSPS
ncbi:sensor histidine kinase [Streptomyces sp. NPDC004327]|uniref:sensor histidine kinase n=1 Tax=Streptomyces sp. NPDC004327 TaxID=3364699 RepID=UPI0036ABCDE7